MKTSDKELPQETLRALLKYDPENGTFTWRRREISSFSNAAKGRSWNTRYADKWAGVKTHGYLKIAVFNKKYYAHRLAFLYITGSFPCGIVDHIDGNGLNNSWRNLRETDKPGNALNPHNKPMPNKTGLTGVCELPSGRFMAQGGPTGNRYIGTFTTAEEAHEAYLMRREKHSSL